MTIASLVVAICGLVLSCLSLSWQAANYVLTGGRVKVTLLVGALGNGGMATGSPDRLSPEWMQNLVNQGYRSPIVAVKVANVGRQPVTVARWGLKSGLGVALTPMAASIGPPLPHRLEVGASETWAVDMEQIQHFLMTAREVLRKPRPAASTTFAGAVEARRRARSEGTTAFVELADGRTKKSRDFMR